MILTNANNSNLLQNLSYVIKQSKCETTGRKLFLCFIFKIKKNKTYTIVKVYFPFIVIIPCVVQYTLECIFILNNLYLPLPYLYIVPLLLVTTTLFSVSVSLPFFLPFSFSFLSFVFLGLHP